MSTLNTKTKRSLWDLIVRTPIFYKILLANSIIVGLGATAGTLITVWYVRRDPQSVHYELIAFFAIAGIALSFIVNKWVLKRALTPLDRLQDAVDLVRQGQRNVRLVASTASDERFSRLVETFNRMLVENEQHARQLQQLPHQILRAQEEERQRLARDLHDEAAQALTSLLVHLRLLERAHDPEKAQQQVQELRQLTSLALEEVRRVSLDLRPTILDDLGLGPALEWRVEEFGQASGIQATIQIDGLTQRLPRNTELVLYRIGQESLTNIARHAQAQQVTVLLHQNSTAIHLEIIDDGLGFNLDAVPTNRPRGLGLLGMRERMAMIDGQLTIESEPGKGTRIRAQAPLYSAGGERSRPGRQR